jgi:hypothetical protein
MAILGEGIMDVPICTLQSPTLIKKKKKFSSYTYKETQMRSVAKWKGFLIYEEMCKYLTIYEIEEAVCH